MAVFATLAFPGESSALNAVFISLTASGPTPADLSIPAGMYPVWVNNDQVTHTVAFANGMCSLQVAPGAVAGCDGFGSSVGDYAYTVDGTAQAHVVVQALHRSVTLAAASHTVARHARLTLHGRLVAPIEGPPNPGASGPVLVLARPDRYHPFHRVATVRARLHGAFPHGRVLWRLHVRPRARTIYIAEANFQPAGGQIWQTAWSRPLRVHVSRR